MNAKFIISTSRKTPRAVRPVRLASLIATLVFGASASCFAAGAVAGAGEAQDVALPNMRLSTNQANDDVSSAAAAPVNSVVAQATAPATRESVRRELMAARANGTMAVTGEIGDNSSTVLAAREHANDVQTDAIVAEYIAEYDRTVAMQNAEQLRAAIEMQGSLNAAMASAGYGGDEPYLPSGSGDEPIDPGVARIDVISIEPPSGAVKPEDELVVVSMPAGDEATQLEQAAAIRRQLGAMGLSQEQVYIEAAPDRD